MNKYIVTVSTKLVAYLNIEMEIEAEDEKDAKRTALDEGVSWSNIRGQYTNRELVDLLEFDEWCNDEIESVRLIEDNSKLNLPKPTICFEI